MEIKFIIEGNDGRRTLFYDGRAYPKVSSGSYFGGCTDYNEGEIESIIKSQKEWLEKSYGRNVKVKIKIINNLNKQSDIFKFLTGDSIGKL